MIFLAIKIHFIGKSKEHQKSFPHQPKPSKPYKPKLKTKNGHFSSLNNTLNRVQGPQQKIGKEKLGAMKRY